MQESCSLGKLRCLAVRLILVGLLTLILWLGNKQVSPLVSTYLDQSTQPVGTLSNLMRMASTSLYIMILLIAQSHLWASKLLSKARQTSSCAGNFKKTSSQVHPDQLTQGWITGLLLASGFVASLIVYGNPRGMYPTHFFSPRWLLVRPIKIEAYTALEKSPDVVVLGSSRAFTIAPSYIYETLGYTAFNASVEGMLPYELPVFFRFLTDQRDNNLPKVLLIEAPPYLADEISTQRIPSSLLPYLPVTETLHFVYDRYTGLFDLEHLAESIFSILRTAEANVDWTFQEDGKGILPPTTQAGLNQSLEQAIANGPPHCQFPTFRTQSHYQELARLAAKHQISLVFVLTPYHPHYYAAHMEVGSPFDICKTRAMEWLANFAGQYTNIWVLDFSLLERIQGIENEQGFYDHQHITEANANLLINAAADTLRQAYQAALDLRNR